MNEKIIRKSLAEHIADDFEVSIISGSLHPGQRVIENVICKTYGVSRAPVREAFQILESRGLVLRELRKGTTVAPMTSSQMADMWRIRASIEGLGMSLAVRNRAPELLEKLRKLHEKMVHAAEKERSAVYHKLNRRFHELIVNACGNEGLIQLIRNLDKRTLRYRMTTVAGPGWMDDSIKMHAAVLAFFGSGDAEAAERIRKEELMGQIDKFSEMVKGVGPECKSVRKKRTDVAELWPDEAKNRRERNGILTEAINKQSSSKQRRMST